MLSVHLEASPAAADIGQRGAPARKPHGMVTYVLGYSRKGMASHIVGGEAGESAQGNWRGGRAFAAEFRTSFEKMLMTSNRFTELRQPEMAEIICENMFLKINNLFSYAEFYTVITAFRIIDLHMRNEQKKGAPQK